MARKDRIVRQPRITKLIGLAGGTTEFRDAVGLMLWRLDAIMLDMHSPHWRETYNLAWHTDNTIVPYLASDIEADLLRSLGGLVVHMEGSLLKRRPEDSMLGSEGFSLKNPFEIVYQLLQAHPMQARPCPPPSRPCPPPSRSGRTVAAIHRPLATVPANLKGASPAVCEALVQAHLKSGAPGSIIELEEESRTYVVKVLGHGNRRHRYQIKGDKLVAVCAWTVDGRRYRKQGSVSLELK